MSIALRYRRLAVQHRSIFRYMRDQQHDYYMLVAVSLHKRCCSTFSQIPIVLQEEVLVLSLSNFSVFISFWIGILHFSFPTVDTPATGWGAPMPMSRLLWLA